MIRSEVQFFPTVRVKERGSKGDRLPVGEGEWRAGVDNEEEVSNPALNPPVLDRACWPNPLGEGSESSGPVSHRAGRGGGLSPSTCYILRF